MPGRMNFEFRWSRPDAARPRRDDPEAPFDVVVLGDFEGASVGTRSRVPDVGARPLWRVDAETFTTVMGRVGPKVTVEGGELVPTDLEHFHPDHLLQALPALAKILALRDAARDPKTFASVAEELGAPPAAPAPVPSAPAENDGATLERLLGRAPAPPPPGSSFVDRLVRDAVAPHIVPKADPRQADVVAAVESALATSLRAALRDPAVRRLEASWRGLHRLAHRIDVGGPVRLHVVQITKDELRDDLAGAGAAGPALRRALERAAPASGSKGFSLIVADLAFEDTDDDMATLAGLGAIGASFGAPVVAQAEPRLAGTKMAEGLSEPSTWTAPSEAWGALRKSSVAPWIALALPRVLARAPYGKTTDPVDRLPFEEVSDDPGPEAFVWTNPAYAVAEAIAARVEAGDPDPLGIVQAEVDDLPFVVYPARDGRKLQPAGEALISDRAAEAVLARGLVPVIADATSPSVRILRLQSVADPATRLGGA